MIKRYFDYAGLGKARKDIIRLEKKYKIAISNHPLKEDEFLEKIENQKDLIKKNLFFGENYQLSYTRNTTEALTIITNSLELHENDEIIISSLEHRSVVNSWELVCLKKKCILKIAEVDFDYTDEQIVDAYLNKVTDKTKVIFCPHIDRNYGIIFPVKKLSEFSIKRNIYMIIDGAQAAGLISIDLDDINCSIYIGSFHKWFNFPSALGFMLVKTNLITSLSRLYVGGKRFKDQNLIEKDFAGDELGTRNVSLEMCVPKAKRLVEGNNRHIKKINYLITQLKGFKESIKILNYINVKGRGFITIQFLNVNENLEKLFYEKYNLIVGRVIKNNKYYIRISYDLYTTANDIRYLLKAIRKYVSTIENVEKNN